VLGFATLGIYFLYLAFRYNVFYVLSISVDTKGDAYGRAMQHLSTGVYLAELCLIGLMSARGAKGPAQLMILLFILTVIYQVYLNLILTPLTTTLSDELMAEDEEEALAQASAEGVAPIDVSANGVQPKKLTRGTGDRTVDAILKHGKRGGLFAAYLFHGAKSKYPKLRQQLWEGFPGEPVPKLTDKVVEHAYHHPAITAKVPKLWIVRDKLGVSRQEVRECKRVTEITDEGASFDEKGKILWDQERLRDAPIWEERVEL
jgi:hypothetical protein